MLVFYVCRLREREERGKRRVEDLHTIAKLQDKLSERDQLIKSLVVRHTYTDKYETQDASTLLSHHVIYLAISGGPPPAIPASNSVQQ